MCPCTTMFKSGKNGVLFEQFEQLYQDRRSFGLVIPNEAGIPKFLSTVIRPSQLKYSEFFYWEGAANFLAGFLKYEPLENPLDFPKYLPSPLTVLRWEKADSFDFAIALVSLLLGVGYNAMCVCGYAPKDITLCNQKRVDFDITKADPPPKKPTVETKPDKHDKNAAPVVEAPKKYEIIVQPKFNREYLVKKAHDRLLLGQGFVAGFNSSSTEVFVRGKTDDDDTLMNYLEKHAPPPPKKADPPPPPPLDNTPPDPLDKLRLHCWVILFKGDREVSDTFYLEPSTGTRYNLDKSPYQAIEFVWNPVNLWVNMQPDPKKEGIGSVSWDLQNINLWEAVLDLNQATPHVQDPSTDPAIAFGKKVDEGAEAASQPAAKSKKDAVVVRKDLRADIDCYHWFLGLSWVPKLDIPSDNYVTRCPKGCKKTLYNNCAHIMFAFYGDYMRWDGLIERLVFYSDDNHEDLVECHDFYQRRKDMLKKRIYYLKEMKVQETFGAGTTSGIKVITIVEGNWRTFEYYPRARIDGLQRREETIGKQVKETYAFRDDSMVYRCVVYEPRPVVTHMVFAPVSPLSDTSTCMTSGSSSSVGGSIRHGSIRSSKRSSKRSSLFGRKSSIQGNAAERRSTRKSKKSWMSKKAKSRPSDRASERAHQLEDEGNSQMLAIQRRFQQPKILAITKITQKYSFVDDVKPSDNVIKKVFRVPLHKTRVDYQFVNGRITNSTKVYEKDGSYSQMHVDPFQNKMEGFAQIDEFHHLQIAEKEAIQEVRDSEVDVVELLEQRAREEQCVVIMTPFSDIAQVKKDAAISEELKLETDYLSPYFPPGVKPRQHLTKPQMAVVRDNCMNALRHRLTRRAEIIKQHHEEETAQLAKNRAIFERDREGMSVAAEEEYEKSCKQATFRIRILEERYAYHEQLSLRKYAEMSDTLQADPRLHELYHEGAACLA